MSWRRRRASVSKRPRRLPPTKTVSTNTALKLPRGWEGSVQYCGSANWWAYGEHAYGMLALRSAVSYQTSLPAQGFGNIVQFELFWSESEFTTIVALIVAVVLRAVQSRLGV
jgi:hypothetical protein